MKQDLPIDDIHRRPAGVDDKTVEAVGKVSEAMEWVERARGHLYEFHQLSGRADLLFGEAVKLLHEAGHDKMAKELDTNIVGRNVLSGRWTFQITEEYNDGYYGAAKSQEQDIREALMDGRRHVFESEMKEARRTRNQSGHEARP